jgi:hypothetical protein
MKLAKKGLTTASLNANDPNFDFQLRVDTTGLGSPEHGLMAVLTSDTQGFAEEYATVPEP